MSISCSIGIPTWKKSPNETYHISYFVVGITYCEDRPCGILRHLVCLFPNPDAMPARGPYSYAIHKIQAKVPFFNPPAWKSAIRKMAKVSEDVIIEFPLTTVWRSLYRGENEALPPPSHASLDVAMVPFVVQREWGSLSRPKTLEEPQMLWGGIRRG